MEIPRYLWLRDKKYLLYEVIDDIDLENAKTYLARQRKRNGTRYYIRTFTIQDPFWLPETKHAIYLRKTINLQKINRRYQKHSTDTRWQNTKWG